MGSNPMGGFGSSPAMGTFKSANHLGKLPSGGATLKGVSGLTSRAENFSVRHATGALRQARPFTAKIRPVRNLAKSIGRKRGF